MTDVTKYKRILGLTPTKVEWDEYQVVLTFPQGVFTFYHEQDCCENVYVESVTGDLQDLLLGPLLVAEQVAQGESEYPKQFRNRDVITNMTRDRLTNTKPSVPTGESQTWSFVKLGNMSDTIIIRWHGSSNGYYSETVNTRWTPHDLQP